MNYIYNIIYIMWAGIAQSVLATRYGLDGPGIESRWGRDFPHPSRPALGPPSPPFNGYRVSFPGVKRPGRDVDHPPYLAPRLKKEQSYTSTSPLGLRGLFWGELMCIFLSRNTNKMQLCNRIYYSKVF